MGLVSIRESLPLDNFDLRFTDGAPVMWGYNSFPDGQVQFWAEGADLLESCGANLTCALKSSVDVDLFLQMLHSVHLHKVRITYLYGARSDKHRAGDRLVACVPEMLFRFMSTSLLSRFYETSRLTEFEIVAPHCDLLLARLFEAGNPKALWPIHPALCVNEPGYDLMVFPDESAARRFDRRLLPGVRQAVCIKHRDQQTGRIVRHEIPEPGYPKKVLVVDDLCDGGATFRSILEHAPLDGVPDLYVTHGVFSGGALDTLRPLYEKIWTTNSYDRKLVSSGFLEVLDVWK